MALNMNFNLGQNSFGAPGCGCSGGGSAMSPMGPGGFGSMGSGFGQMGGCGPMGGMDPMMAMSNQMMNLTMMSMMAMMAQLMQMLMGGSALSGAPGQFGGSSLGGSPLDGFLGGGGGAPQSSGGAAPSGSGGGSAPAGGSTPAGSSTPAGNVDPSTVKDKTGTSGLSAAARSGLDQAHRYGLPLVSGKRSGSGGSDHDHGDAIDVGTLPIGSPSSNGGTPEMKAFAEHMRLEGKAGRSKVKYIIRDGQIASSRGNWEWRPYTYPGKTQAQLDALKKSNPGEYNRLQHFDHVHVSFND